MFVLPDGRPLSLDAPFRWMGVNYPANWLRRATPEERAAIGIEEVPDPPSYDQRFWWSPTVPKDHTQLVEQWAAATRQTANSLLAPTDWIIIREADNGKPADPTLKTWREDIRLATGAKVTAIRETVDTPALATYITGADYPVWPRDPYAPVLDEPAATELIDVDGIQSVSSGEAV